MSWTRNEGTDGAVLRCGAVDGVGWCSGVGRCTGVGVEEEERGAGNGWRGVEINFNPRRAFIPDLITASYKFEPTVMGVHHCRL